MLKSVLTISIVFLCSLMISCKSGAEISSKTSDTGSLLGKWVLKTVAGKVPSTINIKSFELDFQPQGKWSYLGDMAGRYEGMKVSGSGTWSLQRDQMAYTVGRNHGKTTLSVDGDSLLLSPDPVIFLNGKEAVDTRYVKVSR